MGLKHGTLRQSGSSPLPGQEEAPMVRRTLAELFIPRCLRVDNNNEEEDGEDRAGRERKPTLEEWLLSSPGLEDSVAASGSQHRKHSPKVCPLSLTVAYEHLRSTPRRSSATGEGQISFSRSESQKKRVSFRLPDEADIHIIYSHGDAEERDHGRVGERV
ncbi:hypothetical protein OPV22_017576 [Ensete ventricosum]|uniref:Uncharacterized protein n=1 Tax=Ensete ventricosum TaxID=4639 RepID=A0AAV8PHW7_ENSVE|nr:hypothetical protein OPV22_017576 [Ensete ventricosum]